MYQIEVDLRRPPEDRWDELDVRKVRRIVRAAMKELTEYASPLGLAAIRSATYFLEKALARHHEYVREIQSIARYADVPSHDLLLLNLAYDLSACGYQLPGMFGCTAALHRSLETGAPVLDRTMDWAFPRCVGNYSMKITFVGKNFRIETAGFPGLVGIISGMRAGLRGTYGIALNQAFTDSPPNYATPVPWLIRETFEQCATYGSALRHITHRPAAAPGIYMLAAEREGFCIESTGTEDLVYRLGVGPQDCIVRANHFEGEERAEPAPGDSWMREKALIRRLGRFYEEPLKGWPLVHTDTAHLVHMCPRAKAFTITPPPHRVLRG